MGLFTVMQLLIDEGPGAMGKGSDSPTIRFGPVAIDPPPVKKIREKPPKPEPQKDPPQAPERTPVAIETPVSYTLPDFPGLDIPIGPGGSFGQSMCRQFPGNCPSNGNDGDIVVLAAIQPMYPRRAALMGQEGFATVEFTIAAGGTVINPRVTEAKPRRVFDQAALRAIVKWKFKPRYVDGQAVPRRARQTLEFNLD